MTVRALIKRNVKLFFKDKGLFLVALITPVILLVLFATFLGNVYRDGLLQGLPAGIPITEEAVDALVGGQLISSLLAVSCVTVAFSSNFLMVQDKVTGARKDFSVSPVKPALLSVSYYAAALVTTLIVCLTATALCLAYVAVIGWYMSLADVLLLLLDVLLIVLFGTALSSVTNFFLTSQGQISAVGTVVSTGYGYICGAYMPLYTFSDGLRRIVSFFPGTYATSLLRTHATRGALAEIEAQGVPAQAVEGLRDILDCNLYFFGNVLPTGAKYAVLCGTILALIGAYILLNVLKRADR